MPRKTPLTPEERRQERADKRAAEEAEGVFRRKKGRLPAGHVWDEQTGTAVLVPSRAGSSSSAAPLQLASSAATLEGDELRAWLVQHPPPRLAAFDSRDEWDEEREPWFEQLMGERLPLYGDNAARTTAWQAALKRADRGAMAQAALDLLDRVRAAQRLRRQRAEVAHTLRRAQDYLFNKMRVDTRYAEMLKLAQLVEAADSAMHQLRAAPTEVERRAAATLALNELQQVGFADGVEQQVRREVGECDSELTVLAASAHWASQHVPDGSMLWDEGFSGAAANASRERTEASGLALDWQPFFEPEAADVGAAGPDSALARAGLRAHELCLDQEKTIVFAMPPAPALVRWLFEQPVADALATGVRFDDDASDDGASDVAEDDPNEDSCGWTEEEASDWIEQLQTHGSLPLEAIAAGFRAAPYAELKRWVEERESVQGPAWSDLTTEQRKAARILMFGRQSWDAFPRCVRVPWDLLIEEEATAAVALGFTQQAWDAQLLSASEPVAVSAAGRTFVEQLLARAEVQEKRVQEVRAHPVPNREEEPNNRSNDRQMCAWSEVRADSDGKLKWLPRERAWSWYHVQEVL